MDISSINVVFDFNSSSVISTLFTAYQYSFSDRAHPKQWRASLRDLNVSLIVLMSHANGKMAPQPWWDVCFCPSVTGGSRSNQKGIHTLERLGTLNSICLGVLLQRSISTPTSTRVIAATSSFSHCVQTTRASKHTAQLLICKSFKFNYRNHVMYIYCCVHYTWACRVAAILCVCSKYSTDDLADEVKASWGKGIIIIHLTLNHTCVSATCLNLCGLNIS